MSTNIFIILYSLFFVICKAFTLIYQLM